MEIHSTLGASRVICRECLRESPCERLRQVADVNDLLNPFLIRIVLRRRDIIRH